MICRIKTMKNKWNSVARQLYILSEKKFVKTPKQCRERWLNYLDPSKVHCPWTSQQDLTLLLSIKENGKKWAFTVKKLLKKRTEHMVKNRFNSLINNEKKKVGNKSESQLLESAIETATKTNRSSENISNAESVRRNYLKNQEIEEEDSQSLFVLEKQRNSKKSKNKKETTKKKGIKVNLISSIPTEISLQKGNIEPTETNDVKLSDLDDPISFFQEQLQDLKFNPFEDFVPNDSIMAPDFFFPYDDNDNHFHHQELSLAKQDNVMDFEAPNILQ